jgi:hypothetical protein
MFQTTNQMIDVIDDLPLTNSPVAKRYQMQKIFGR